MVNTAPSILRPEDPGIQKLLVVDLGVLGDTVHLLPALWDLRVNFPGARLHVATSPVGAELLGVARVANRVWPLEQDSARRSRREQWATIRAWRRERFDLALTFSGSDRAVLTAAASGARVRIAHAAGRRHFWNPWLIGHWIPRQSRNLPVFEQRRQVLQQAGLPLGPVRFGLEPAAEDRSWAAENVPDGSIHLSLHASSPYKEWPLEHWLVLARRLLETTSGGVLATTGPSERERRKTAAFGQALQDARVRVWTGPEPLGRLTAALERCSLHAGVDSGVTHLAMAVGAPTVSIFRDYDGRAEWTPPGDRHRQLVRGCECLGGPISRCRNESTARCLASIRPEEATEAALALLSAPH